MLTTATEGSAREARSEGKRKIARENAWKPVGRVARYTVGRSGELEISWRTYRGSKRGAVTRRVWDGIAWRRGVVRRGESWQLETPRRIERYLERRNWRSVLVARARSSPIGTKHLCFTFRVDRRHLWLGGSSDSSGSAATQTAKGRILLLDSGANETRESRRRSRVPAVSTKSTAKLYDIETRYPCAQIFY